jgi:ribonuclease G
VSGLALYVDYLPGETRIAWVESDRLRDLEIVRAGSESLVGNIYLGRVTKIISGIQSAFVEIGTARSGFLSTAESGPVTEGASLIVQVQKDAVGEKGPKVTPQVALPGRWVVHTPLRPEIRLSRKIDAANGQRLKSLITGAGDDRGGGFILRTAAASAVPDALAAEAERLRAEWEVIRRKAEASRAPACLHQALPPVLRALSEAIEVGISRAVYGDPGQFAEARAFAEAYDPDAVELLALHSGSEPLFEAEGLEEQIDAALHPVVALSSGGSIVIETTAALTAIDVNSGSAGGSTGLGRQGLSVNLEAAAEIGRQIRLRNLAGQLVIDFLPLRGRQGQEQVLETLRAALADDPCPSQVAGFTRLGLVEMTRERRRAPLLEVLGARHRSYVGKSALSIAFEALRRVPAAAAAEPGRAIVLRLPPAVATALSEEARSSLQQVEARLGRPLAIIADANLPPDRFEIASELAGQGRRGHG